MKYYDFYYEFGFMWVNSGVGYKSFKSFQDARTFPCSIGECASAVFGYANFMKA